MIALGGRVHVWEGSIPMLEAMALTSRYKQRTESLPNTLSSAMFGNGQITPEDNPNHLVYKKVRQ